MFISERAEKRCSFQTYVRTYVEQAKLHMKVRNMPTKQYAMRRMSKSPRFLFYLSCCAANLISPRCGATVPTIPCPTYAEYLHKIQESYIAVGLSRIQNYRYLLSQIKHFIIFAKWIAFMQTHADKIIFR